MKSSPLQASAKGDIVWAKASRFAWWLGQVKSVKGSLISISLFGCNKTRSFNSLEILGFEEAYPRMVKMVGVKLSYEIGLALDELARNIAIGLKCCCRVSAADEDESFAVKRGFNPQEIHRFLLNKAAFPQVFEEEIASVVRVSAALNAFRFGFVVCNTSEVGEGFCAEGLLDFVLDMAVNQRVDDKAVAQLTAFRQFTSVKPAWFYQLDWEFEEDSLESHKIEVDLELPDCTSEDDELYLGRTRHPEIDVSIKPREDCELLDSNHKNKEELYHGRIRDPEVYLSIKPHEECELLGANNKHKDELYHGRSRDPEANVSINLREGCELLDANHKHERREICVINMVDFSYIDTEEKYEFLIHDRCQMDVDVAQSAGRGICRNTSHERIVPSCTEGVSAMTEVDTNETPADVIFVSSNSEFFISSPQNDPNHRSVVPNFENGTGEGNNSMPAHSDNSVEVGLSSAENLSSLRTVPFYRGQLHSLPTNKCSIYSPPIKSLKISIKPQCRWPDAFINTSNASLLPEMAPFAESALQISANKRKLFDPTTFENYISSQTLEANGGLHFSNQTRFLNHSGHVSKPCPRNRRQSHHLESNCKVFYLSPLTRDGPSSTTNNRRNSSSSVLLIMKFPKDYTLPSKEELEKKFGDFGPLNHARTKVFFYTGVGQVVFLHQADAVVAYNYVTRKKFFGQANVRFWFYKYENYRNDSSDMHGAVHSSLNLKSCLKKSCTTELIDNRKKCRVKFTM